jgi:hypothetical protein
MGYLKYQVQLSHIKVERTTEFVTHTYLKIRDPRNGSWARFKYRMVGFLI